MKRAPPRVTASLQIKNQKFYIVARIPNNQGKLQQKWISTGLSVTGNKRKAKQMLDEKLLELQQQYEQQHRIAGWSDSDVADAPFMDVVNRWLASKRSSLAPSTVEGYQRILGRLRSYFEPLHLSTKEISPQIVDEYIKHLIDDGLSSNTVRHHLTLLKSVFNDEIKNGVPLLNPVKCVKPPKVETYEAKTYSIEELGALFKAFEGDELDDIIHVAVLYGLRRSEICGLRWQDVDFVNNLIHVRHKISEVKVDGERRLIKTNELKTESSRRSFPLSDEIKIRLERRRKKIAENRVKIADYYNDDKSYIFVHDDGHLITPNFVTDHFRQKLKASKLPHLRFHDLRHTCATLLLQEGCSLREIQAYLGHATYVTTTRYAHVDGRSKQNALDKIDRALANNN